jgi:phage shock protein E
MIKNAGNIIAEAQSKIDCVDVETALSLYDKSEGSIILDVREESAANESKLQDSFNIPRGVIEMKIQKLCPEENTLILVHCAGGGRASLTTLTLQNMGYKNAHAITATYNDIKQAFG